MYKQNLLIRKTIKVEKGSNKNIEKKKITTTHEQTPWDGLFQKLTTERRK